MKQWPGFLMACFLCSFCAGLATAASPILLWSGGSIDSDRVRNLTSEGVELRPDIAAGDTQPRLIPWIEIRSLGSGWAGGDRYEHVIQSLWRSEDRLARGDASGSARLLEPLALEYLPRSISDTASEAAHGEGSGPTTGQIASALTMTRLLEGRVPGALDAWLAWRAGRGGPQRAWIDPFTGLCPALPPIFDADTASAWLALAGEGLADDAMRALYRYAAGLALGHAVEMPALDARARSDPGVRLVLDMLRAQTEGDASARRGAREALERRASTTDDAWVRAWIHLAVGRALLAEEDRVRADAGSAELITVVIDHQHTAPGLAALARHILEDYFLSTDRPGHAERVRAMDRWGYLGVVADDPDSRAEAEPETP